MARKKRSKRNGGKEIFLAFLKTPFHFMLKVIPILLLIFAGGAAFVGVRGSLFADPHLSIQHITVTPPDALSRDQRLRLESLLAGKNILRADIHKISTMLEKDPWIEAAVVTKRVPSEISIEVRRRVPAAWPRPA